MTHNRPANALVCLLLGLAMAAVPNAAEADDGPTGRLRLGGLYSLGGGDSIENGFGLDARYQIFPSRDIEAFAGLFGQGQLELGDAWRVAAGLNAGWGFFGLELGVSHRTATSQYAGSTGLHIAQSLTFGPVSVGARLTIPLVDHLAANTAATNSVQGIEGALTVRLSWGFTVHGERRRSGCHAARTPRIRDPHGQSHH